MRWTHKNTALRSPGHGLATSRLLRSSPLPLTFGAVLLLTQAGCSAPSDATPSQLPALDWTTLDSADFSQLNLACFKASGEDCSPDQLPGLRFSLARASEDATAERALARGGTTQASASDDVCSISGDGQSTVSCSSQVLPRLNGTEWFSMSLKAEGLMPEQCILTSLGDPSLNRYTSESWYRGLQSQGILPKKVDNPLAVEHCQPLGTGYDGSSLEHQTTCPWPMADKDYSLEAPYSS